jgi:hypothetical protein
MYARCLHPNQSNRDKPKFFLHQLNLLTQTCSQEINNKSKQICALFAWLISHQPAVLFSLNKSATSNQSTVLFSQNKPAPAVSHQPNEQADGITSQHRLVVYC